MDNSSSLASNSPTQTGVNIVGSGDGGVALPPSSVAPSGSGSGSGIGGGGLILHDNPDYHYVPPNSIDPAWKWGAAKSSSNTTSIFCRLCRRTPSGGITRFKQHLIGKTGNVAACPSATEAIKKEIIVYMNATTTRKRAEKEIPLPVGTSTHVEPGPSSNPPHGKGPMAAFVRFGDSKRQTTLEDRYKKEERDRVCQSIGRWLYESGIPFNVVRSPSFQVMIDDIGKFGQGLRAPSYHEIREPLLEREVTRVKTFVDGFKQHWEQYGCSIMSDGWTDKKRRTLLNFLVHCPQGTIFLRSIDASDIVKDANNLYKLLKEVILEVGEKNVVQVVTDNASNYVAAGKLLTAEFPHLFWTPCAAHCIDLMLEDIGKTRKLRTTFAKTKRLVVFLYNHGQTLHMMREFTGGKELHRPAVTRFATRYLTFESIWSAKDGLRSMFVSTQWQNCYFSKEGEGKRCQEIVLQQNFWKGVSFALKVMGPLVDVLRMVDSDEKPSMGYIYEKMDRVKEQIKVNLKNKEEHYQFVWDIVDNRWDNQMHKPLHAAGLYLNPGLYYDNKEIEYNPEIKDGLFHVIFVLCENMEEQSKITTQLLSYRGATGPFGMELAIKARKECAPAEWWLSFGYGCRELQRLAIRVLSLTCSATPCERNWSTFEMIHTKKRNRLHHQKLNDLAFVQYNEKLRRRYEERKARGDSFDPITLATVEDNDEWPSEDEYVGEDRDLTWHEVEIASGVREKEGTSTRSSTRKKRKKTQNKGKGKRVAVVEEEEELSSRETEEDDSDAFESTSFED